MEDDQNTGVTDPAAGDFNMDELDGMPEDRTVPIAVLKKIREESKQKVEAEREASRMKDDQILILRSHLQANQGQPAAAQRPSATSDPIAAFFADRDPDEPITVREMQMLANMSQNVTADHMRLQQAQKDPDFKELISTHITNVLRSKPELATTLRSLPTEPARWLLAYELAKTDPEYTRKQLSRVPESEEAKKVKENLSKPNSPASVSGSSVASSEADRIARMSSEEFRKYKAEKIQAGRG
jgi:hypothetical protein